MRWVLIPWIQSCYIIEAMNDWSDTGVVENNNVFGEIKSKYFLFILLIFLHPTFRSNQANPEFLPIWIFFLSIFFLSPHFSFKVRKLWFLLLIIRNHHSITHPIMNETGKIWLQVDNEIKSSNNCHHMFLCALLTNNSEALIGFVLHFMCNGKINSED